MAVESKEKLTKTKKIIWLILILLLLLIIAAVIYLILVYFKKVPSVNVKANLNQVSLAPVPPPLPTSFNTANSKVLADLEGVNKTPPINQNEQTNALFIATAFAERFGSYSNQSNYKNLDELEIFLTPSMSKWVATYKADLIKSNPNLNTYYAIETKAISTQTNLLDEKSGKAEIVVKTQRQEFKNTIANPRVFYQDILLKLVKINKDWKVDGAYWQ